ncbi:class D sortase [Paenibacillus lentus]|uniref:Class D sortase n=1 Tax=Paenibacillus lentus TaxID=1338368 RepID=A0A3S8S107_9BACL|nr:class D sortase [Paenibacillus lentus]AZK48769.1 class D sortase [Paenibacillus lentus]
MRRVIAYFLFVLGMLIMIFPKVNEYYENIQTQKLLHGIENDADYGDVEFNNAAIDRLLLQEYQNVSQTLEDSIIEIGTNNDFSNDVQLEEELVPLVTETHHSKAIAVIKIAKIKLNLPILEGATKSNMKFAAAHLKETDPLGGQGNAAIAAHRAKTKGRLFNRLDEIEVGDEIVIEVGSRIYVYETDKISIVKPTDVSVLKRGVADESFLTLITCEPIVNPTHRLIVRAKLKQL